MLVALGGAHVRDGVVILLVAVPPRDEDVANGGVDARALRRPALHLHHVLERVELPDERGAVGQLIASPPAPAHGRRLLRRAPDELHGEVREHRRHLRLKLEIRAPSAPGASAAAERAPLRVAAGSSRHLDGTSARTRRHLRRVAHRPRRLARSRQEHGVALHQPALELFAQRRDVQAELSTLVRRVNHDVHRGETRLLQPERGRVRHAVQRLQRLLQKLLDDELGEVEVVVVDGARLVVDGVFQRGE